MQGGVFLKNKVEQLRKERGLNQDDFAKMLRVSRQTISSIETGKYNPSLELAFAISDFFGKRIEQHDELKTKIRDRAGRYTYSLGLLVVCFSILVFGILGALEVIDNARMIVLYLSGYLLFQVIAGIVIFNKLMKKY